LCGQSVQERLVKLGINRNTNFFTEEDDIIFIKEYNTHANNGTLDILAKSLNRDKPTICRHAKELGITTYARKRGYQSGALSIRVTEWHKTHDHPRGMLGKKHSAEVCKDMSIRMFKMQKELTEEQKDARSLRCSLLARKSLNNRTNCTWKAGWRVINGKRKYYRSRWEANYARYLEFLLVNGNIKDWAHESETFWFEGIKRGCLSYLPDFKVMENNGDVSYHEVKGWMDARSKTVLRRMKKYHPKVKIVLIQEKQYNEIKSKLSNVISNWE
jgi:ribosomal protein S13